MLASISHLHCVCLCVRSQSLTIVLVLQRSTLRYNDHTSFPHTPKAANAHMWPVHRYFILPAAKIKISWCFLFYHKAQTPHRKHERLTQHSFSTLLLFCHQTKPYEAILQCSTIIHSSLKSRMNRQLGIRTNKMKKITNQKRCGGQEMKVEAEKRLKLRCTIAAAAGNEITDGGVREIQKENICMERKRYVV